VGSSHQAIPGLLNHLASYDSSQSWLSGDSSRRGKIKILHPTSQLQMTFGLKKLVKSHKPSVFIFHYVVRDGDYDHVLDSGTKIITLSPGE
jgi:hypothetical protein